MEERVRSGGAQGRLYDRGHEQRRDPRLRGALYLRQALHPSRSIIPGPVHILDWACKSQRHVTRSTFSAELLGAGDVFGQGMEFSLQQKREKDAWDGVGGGITLEKKDGKKG